MNLQEGIRVLLRGMIKKSGGIISWTWSGSLGFRVELCYNGTFNLKSLVDKVGGGNKKCSVGFCWIDKLCGSRVFIVGNRLLQTGLPTACPSMRRRWIWVQAAFPGSEWINILHRCGPLSTSVLVHLGRKRPHSSDVQSQRGLTDARGHRSSWIHHESCSWAVG